MKVKGIEFRFGVGGDDKKNSSSSLLKNWKYDSEDRIWGSFHNFYDSKEVKVKELIVSPKKGMSFQKHKQRNEIWLVTNGSCEVIFAGNDPNQKERIILNKFDHFIVDEGQWHQIVNPFEEKCHIIEIQYGDSVIEDDIERLSYYEDEYKIFFIYRSYAIHSAITRLDGRVVMQRPAKPFTPVRFRFSLQH